MLFVNLKKNHIFSFYIHGSILYLYFCYTLYIKIGNRDKASKHFVFSICEKKTDTLTQTHTHTHTHTTQTHTHKKLRVIKWKT